MEIKLGEHPEGNLKTVKAFEEKSELCLRRKENYF